MKWILMLASALWLIPLQVMALSVPAVVSPQWLMEHLQDPQLAVIEFSDEASYVFDGHIPGSVNSNKSDWRYLSKENTLLHYSPSQLQQKLRALGINHDSAVVIYYKGDSLNEILGSYYLFWLLHYLGHTNVSILDRGWYGWNQANGPVEQEVRTITPGDFVARPLPALEIALQELNAIRTHYLLVDGRFASHYAGKTKFPANLLYGRIPGSVNFSWQEQYVRKAANGRLYAQRPTIARVQKILGNKRDRPILLVCLGGTGAAVNYSMFYAAGYENIRLNDAGFRGWNQLGLPLEKTARNQ